MAAACPSLEQLERLLRETLTQAEQVELLQHLDTCAECRRRLESLAGGVEEWLRKAAQGPAPSASQLGQVMGHLLASDIRGFPASPDQALASGATLRYFGDYEILEEIGRGGMGVVYKARQVSLNRTVALKLILAGQLASPSEVRRFRTEAEAAAMLDHPNIVPIHEIGEHEGRHYFSMKLVEGGSLAERSSEFRVSGFELGEAPLDSEMKTRNSKLAALVAAIARAVHYAHQRGVLHRDLKPSNILLDAQSQPHLTDFGLAKILERDSGLTHSAAIMGTPNYIAPEVAAGKAKEVTTAADVFSLGAILYELLTGRPPFQEETVAATLQKVLHADPTSPRSLNPSVPRDLETACLRCLEKEPGRRYVTAAALADDLERLGRGEPILSRRVSTPEKLWRWSRRKPALAAALGSLLVALVAGVVGVFGQWQRAEEHARLERLERERAEGLARSEARERQRAEEHARRETEQRQRAEFDRAELLLSQGRLELPLAYLARLLRHNPTNAAVTARLQSVLSARGFCLPALPPLQHRQPIHTARFSPDGRHILTAAREPDAKIWDARTGEVKYLFPHGEAVQAAAFSPDGTLVATGSDDTTVRLWRMVDGQSASVALTHDGPVHLLQFSPDGRTLLTASGSATRLWDVASGQLVVFPQVRHRNRIVCINFSPDGRYFVSVGEAAAMVWNATTGKLVGENIRGFGRPPHAAFTPDGKHLLLAHARLFDWASGQWLTNQMDVNGLWNFASAFSPDGRRLFIGTGEFGARLFNLDTSELLLPPLRHEQPINHVAFSPDGSKVLTTGRDGLVIVWDAHRGHALAAPIRHHQQALFAEFSPDGTRVLTLPAEPRAYVWDLRVDQPMSRRMLHGEAVASLRFSRDGTKVLSASHDGTARIWAAATGRELRPPLRHSDAVNAAVFSPDEALVATASADHTAIVWSATTGERLAGPLRHDKIIRTVEFDFTGGRLVTAADDGTARVWDTTNGVELRVLAHDAPRVNSAHFSADGSQVLTSGNDRRARLWDVQTGRAVLTLRHRGPVAGAVFTPEGRRMVTVSADRTARLWDRFTGWSLNQPIEHPAGVRGDSPEFHPAGRHMLTVAGYSVYLWNLDDGSAAVPPMTHQDLITSALFSPDGRLIATVSRDRTARLWDSATGLPVSEPLPHSEGVECAAFSRDGRWLATGAADGSVQLWEVPALPDRVPAWLPELVEAVVRQRLNERSLIEPVPPTALAEAKEAIARDLANEELVRWAKWFLADSATRSISPASTVTVPEYVQRRVEEDRRDSLQEATCLSSTNALAFARLARNLIGTNQTGRAGAMDKAEWFSRYATNLAPSDPEVRQIREAVVQRLPGARRP